MKSQLAFLIIIPFIFCPIPINKEKLYQKNKADEMYRVLKRKISYFLLGEIPESELINLYGLIRYRESDYDREKDIKNQEKFGGPGDSWIPSQQIERIRTIRKNYYKLIKPDTTSEDLHAETIELKRFDPV